MCKATLKGTLKGLIANIIIGCFGEHKHVSVFVLSCYYDPGALPMNDKFPLFHVQHDIG